MKTLRVGVSLLVLVLIVALAACGSTTTTGGPDTTGEATTPTGEATTTSTSGGPLGTVSIMGVWGGTELDSFNEVLAAWEQTSGGRAEFEATRDLTAILRARVQGGNPPDLAILPNPALLQEFAREGDLKPLTDVLDQTAVSENFAQTWIDQASMDGALYGVFVRASTKSTVWYNPKQFTDANLQPPTTWDELISMTDQLRNAGGAAPWAIGVESAAASGWPGTDWIQEILLHESGPDVYDQWVAHQIPWTDPQVKSAWEKFGQIALTEGNVAGGAQAIIATNYQDALFQLYQDPPQAYMDFLGSFGQGFIQGQFPDLQPFTGYDFFAFPAINEQFANSATGGADVVVMFNDTPTARALVQYLADAKSWEVWAKTGAYTTPNKALDPSIYPDEVVAKAAAQLTDSQIFRIDADDLMPSVVQQAFWKGVLDYLGGASLDTVLQSIETSAAGAYTTTTGGATTSGDSTTTDESSTTTT